MNSVTIIVTHHRHHHHHHHHHHHKHNHHHQRLNTAEFCQYYESFHHKRYIFGWSVGQNLSVIYPQKRTRSENYFIRYCECLIINKLFPTDKEKHILVENKSIIIVSLLLLKTIQSLPSMVIKFKPHMYILRPDLQTRLDVSKLLLMAFQYGDSHPNAERRWWNKKL